MGEVEYEGEVLCLGARVRVKVRFWVSCSGRIVLLLAFRLGFKVRVRRIFRFSAMVRVRDVGLGFSVQWSKVMVRIRVRFQCEDVDYV